MHEQQVKIGAGVGEGAQTLDRAEGTGVRRLAPLLARRLCHQQRQHVGAPVATMSTRTSLAAHDAVVGPTTDGVGAHAEERGDVGNAQPVSGLGLAPVYVRVRAHDLFIGILPQNLTKAASEPPTAGCEWRPARGAPAAGAVYGAVAPASADGSLTAVPA